MGMNMLIYQIVNEFKKNDEVIAIALAGSGASGRKDNYSDIDIDIITSKEIAIVERERIIKKLSDMMEINNTFWGTSDEFIMRNSSIQIDISYFDFKWLEQKVEDVVEKKQASIGYTTCFWHNVINSMIVYDKDGKFENLQKKYTIKYPSQLKKNIIAMNYPILKNNFSSYYNQIDKAIKRNDIVNLNNRVSAFLDSYFDIIFAVNEIPHPGEKRLLSISQKICEKLPENIFKDIDKLLQNICICDKEILENIDNIMLNLDRLLKSEGLIQEIDNVYKECKY